MGQSHPSLAWGYALQIDISLPTTIYVNRLYTYLSQKLHSYPLMQKYTIHSGNHRTYITKTHFKNPIPLFMPSHHLSKYSLNSCFIQFVPRVGRLTDNLISSSNHWYKPDAHIHTDTHTTTNQLVHLYCNLYCIAT